MWVENQQHRQTMRQKVNNMPKMYCANDDNKRRGRMHTQKLKANYLNQQQTVQNIVE